MFLLIQYAYLKHDFIFTILKHIIIIHLKLTSSVFKLFDLILK